MVRRSAKADRYTSRDKHRGDALAAGMVLTVEPGCYLRPDDLTVPERYRGIGVRIEDDVLITADGCRVMSSALPTRADEVEAWMANVRA
jgi:Xaa-Pro aminopeptidase